MKTDANSDLIKIPFDIERTPRSQIAAAIASVPPRCCHRHPHELLAVDTEATIRKATGRDNYPYEDTPRRAEFSATYSRCIHCPHSDHDYDIDVDDCPVGYARIGRSLIIRDDNGRPLPRHFGSVAVKADQSAREQFEAWLASEGDRCCPRSKQALRRINASVKVPFGAWAIEPQFAPCLQCGLERLGITADEARASFDTFVVDPPTLQAHLDICRAFANAPKGVLLLLGNVGVGKTHLAVSILRERLRQAESGLRFVKHRHFVAEHWQASRPVAFGDEAPASPLVHCQGSSLLVYDELTSPQQGRPYEDLLLDLFEARLGSFKPSVITSNLTNLELEAAIGTRLCDRLRRATYAVLEFGIESKRAALNTEYLQRSPR